MPVHSSHLLRYEELRLGERIREIRQHHGVTLRELAAKVDTSPARLSQIENDRLHLALEELEALTAALNVPLEALLPAEQTLPYQIVRDVESRGTAMHPASAGDGRDGSVDATHGLRPLADLFVGRHMEPLLARIEPGEGESLHFSYDDQQQFTFVLRGSLEFRVKTPDGERHEQLERGDCFYFRSDMPHAFRSAGELSAESFHVICSPSASLAGAMEQAHRRAIAHDGRNIAAVQQRTGERDRLLRELHGWSTERVARASGLPERIVTRIERGDRAMPLEALLKLARALGRPLREIVALTTTEQP